MEWPGHSWRRHNAHVCKAGESRSITDDIFLHLAKHRDKDEWEESGCHCCRVELDPGWRISFMMS